VADELPRYERASRMQWGSSAALLLAGIFFSEDERALEVLEPAERHKSIVLKPSHHDARCNPQIFCES